MELKYSLYKTIINIFCHHALVVVGPKHLLDFNYNPSVIFQIQEQVIIIQVFRGRLKREGQVAFFVSSAKLTFCVCWEHNDKNKKQDCIMIYLLLMIDNSVC